MSTYYPTNLGEKLRPRCRSSCLSCPRYSERWAGIAKLSNQRSSQTLPAMIPPLKARWQYASSSSWVLQCLPPYRHTESYNMEQKVHAECGPKYRISAETILTLKNRESIHFAKFVHDTCADTFFWRIDSFYELILGKIRHIPERKGCQICIMKAEKGFLSLEKWPIIMKVPFFSTFLLNNSS